MIDRRWTGRLDGGNQTKCRTALSVPLINCFTHVSVAGPVLASHPFDLQEWPMSKLAHVGAPSVNVETKLTGVNDNEVEQGGDPVGKMAVRGPSVGATEGMDEDWVGTGTVFRVRANGAFEAV
jgi:long-chain acyl-CoA synthetase